MMKTLGKISKYSYLGLILLFLYAPLLVMVVYSFNDSGTLGSFSGFSLRWYIELFTNPRNSGVLSALYVTVLCALISSVISMVFGTLAAIGIYAFRRGVRNAILNVTYLPMLNPDIVTGISLMLLMSFIHIPFGFVSLVLAHITFNVPYVIFAVLPKLNQLDMHTYEAALDLGAKPSTALRKIIVPQVVPGVVTGGLLAFTLSMDDFIISYFTAGDVENLSVRIFSQLKLRGITPELNALSALMFVVVLLLLLAVNRRSEQALLF